VSREPGEASAARDPGRPASGEHEVRWERDGDVWREITTRTVPDDAIPRCEECGKPMPGSRKDRLTCSDRCRVRKWRRARA
jgi:hypothetical protein